MTQIETYTVVKDDRHFESLLNLSLCVDILTISVYSINKIDFDAGGGGYCTLECRAHKAELKVPCFGPARAKILGEEIEKISIKLLKKAETKVYNINISTLSNFQIRLFAPHFLAWYELEKNEITKNHGPSPKKWPSDLQALWHIRNAIAHNCRFEINDENLQCVSVGDATISREISGQPLETHFSTGDLLYLILAYYQNHS